MGLGDGIGRHVDMLICVIGVVVRVYVYVYVRIWLDSKLADGVRAEFWCFYKTVTRRCIWLSRLSGEEGATNRWWCESVVRRGA